MQATAKQRQRALLPRLPQRSRWPPQGLVHVQGAAKSGRDLRQQRQAEPALQRRVHVELVLRWSATPDARWANTPWGG
ncbi:MULTISPECIES: hypothetical protein [unclassified Streptomyces]|uniref:hypothetical protein n=1 Tax=unclassified Streptomyces TaxID=2593676 RepID=UPI00359CB201